MAYLSKLFALEGGGGDYKLDESNLILNMFEPLRVCVDSMETC